MKPKTKLQMEIVNGSRKLAPVSEAQKRYAYKHCFVHYFKRDAKGNCFCLDCGHTLRDKEDKKNCKCPHCGSIHFISKGTQKKRLVSTPINDQPVKIITHLKRYKCLDCTSYFSDSNPIAYENWSFTKVAIISILNKLKPYNATYASIARMFGVSTTRIIDVFDAFVRIKRHNLPKILLIDEFHFSRHTKYKYPAILMNFENNLIIDIIESRTHDIMSDYFFKINLEERKKVEYICTDMSFIFKPLLKTYFPNSTLLVDHFHVTKFVNDQLNNTRKRVMRKYASNKKSLEYRLLKHRYKLLLKSRNDIDLEIFKYDNILEHYATENIILEQLLNCDEELRQAYNAKEEYLIFDQVTQKEINNCNNKRMELTSLIKRFRHTQVEESIKVAETLNNWKEEILNSFIWINNRRISNGPVEGKNNYIKKILSNANGMVNFKRARNRILYSQNKYETYSTKEHKDKIKRPSNPRGTYKKNKK